MINRARTLLINKPTSAFNEVDRENKEYIPHEYTKTRTNECVEMARDLLFIKAQTPTEVSIWANRLITLIYSINLQYLLSDRDNVTYDVTKWPLGTDSLSVIEFIKGLDILLPRLRYDIKRSNEHDVYGMIINAPTAIHKLAYYIIAIINITEFYNEQANNIILVENNE